MIRTQLHSTITRTILVAVAILATTAMTLPAAAQDDGARRGRRGQRQNEGRRGGFGGMLEPSYVRRDVPLFAEHLELDKGQTVIVETLILDYQSAFGEAADGMRDRFGELRPQEENREERRAQRTELANQMRSIRDELRALREKTPEGEEMASEEFDALQKKMEPLRGKMDELRPQRPEGPELQRMMEGISSISRDWRKERQTLDARFKTDLIAVLSPTQVEMWPAFERTLRREKTVSRGRLSGERVDLFHVVRDMRLADVEAETVQPVLEEYALALDRALVAREEEAAVLREQRLEAMSMSDVERAAALSRQESDLNVAVRSVNDRYVDAVTARMTEELSEDLGREFSTAYRRAAYARIYRTNRMEQSFDIAKAFEDLDEETLVAIWALEESYLTNLEHSNRRLVEVTREVEPARTEQRQRRWAARMNGEERGAGRSEATDPLREAMQTRDELNQRFRTQLEAMLTPEQVEKLPELRPQRERGNRRFGDRGFGPGGEGGDERRAERRARMIEQFDADGDGELSDAEWEEARETFRQRFRDGGGRGGRGGRGGGEGGGRGGGGRGGPE